SADLLPCRSLILSESTCSPHAPSGYRLMNLRHIPKVTIVIPTYNRPERLRHALVSVMQQTVGDFEVFVVDDGSRDATADEVVRGFADARLHCIRLPTSRGPGAARNAGVIRAVAPFIAFLDDDDEWLPEKLEVQLGFLESCENSVGGVYAARIT